VIAAELSQYEFGEVQKLTAVHIICLRQQNAEDHARRAIARKAVYAARVE
jgi:hypothetical protein